MFVHRYFRLWRRSFQYINYHNFDRQYKQQAKKIEQNNDWSVLATPADKRHFPVLPHSSSASFIEFCCLWCRFISIDFFLISFSCIQSFVSPISTRNEWNERKKNWKWSIAIFLFGRNLSVVLDKFWRWTVGMNAVQIGRDGKYYQAQYSHHYTTRRIYPFHLRHARVSNVKGNVWHVISVHCIILFCIN